jgi:transposase
MLGPPKTRNLDRPVLISLESAVPQDHFYRHLERTLDLSFVRALVADRYAVAGRPSIDPVVFFKLHLIMFFAGLRSERQLIAIARLNLAHRCGCPLGAMGYNLDEPPPDHSSLSKIRTRLGLPIRRRFFEAIVEECVAAGFVWDKELIFDATNLPRGHPVPMRRWIRFNRPCISLWTTISRRSPWPTRPRKRVAGSCSRSVDLIPIAHQRRTMSIRAISARVQPTPMQRSCDRRVSAPLLGTTIIILARHSLSMTPKSMSIAAHRGTVAPD